MAEDVNAALDDSFSNAAAWVPVSLIARKDGSAGRFFHLIDRAKPGVIAVTRDGRRFTNESENYHDFVCAMIDACAGAEEVSAFMICDHRTIRRYGLGAVRPSPLPLFPYVRSGYLKTGRSIGNWRSSAGIDRRKSRADHRGGQSRRRRQDVIAPSTAGRRPISVCSATRILPRTRASARYPARRSTR